MLGNKTPKEIFTGERPEVRHLRIFGFLVYVHVPKDKRSKLEPLRNKGIFVGYNESSKEYRVYISSYKQIETSIDVTFDEDSTFSILKYNHLKDIYDKDPEDPRVADTNTKEHVPKEHDMEEPQKPKDPPWEMTTYKGRPTWAHEIIQDAEKYGALDRSFRESKRPWIYCNYMDLLSDIINV